MKHMHKIVAAACVAALLAFAFHSSSCVTLEGAAHLDSMTDAEFQQYVASAGAEMTSLADVAVAAGDVDRDDFELLRGILRSYLDGTLVGSMAPMMEALNLSGYGGFVFTSAILRLDSKMQRQGAFDEDTGAMTPRAKAVVADLVARIDKRLANWGNGDGD